MSTRIDINLRLFPLLLLLFFLCFPLFLPSFNSWLQYCKIDIHANKGTVTRAKKRTTCFATLLQNELNSDAARFTTDNFFCHYWELIRMSTRRDTFIGSFSAFVKRDLWKLYYGNGKVIGLISKTTTPLYTCMTLFCNFFAVLYTTTARNFTVSILACAQSLPQLQLNLQTSLEFHKPASKTYRP